MRLVVTLLVRDEVDVIAANVEHHLAAGASHIIVTDNGSIDGTVEVLEEYAASAPLDLLHEPGQDYDQAAWVTRMARRAHDVYAADWVVNADADELWCPDEGGWDLAARLGSLSPEVMQVRAWRRNFVPARDSLGPWVDRLVLRDLHSLSERGTPLGPKVCHRSHPAVEVLQGNHSVTGLPDGILAEGVVQILHMPLRSYKQFARKIRNGGASYASNTTLPAEAGWHWRADYERLLAGTLARVVEERLPVAPVDPDLYRYDTTLRDRLRALVPTAVRPQALLDVLAHP